MIECRAVDMTDDCWDYVFALNDKHNPKSMPVDKTKLDKLRREFNYW